MGFSGRCEAIKAPTTENDTVRVGMAARPAIVGPQAKKITARVRPLRRARIGVAAASATHSTHSDQASHGAARRLIPPSARLCSLATLVTTLLYSITDSQALQQRQSTLEAKRSRGIGRIPELVGKFFPT